MTPSREGWHPATNHKVHGSPGRRRHRSRRAGLATFGRRIFDSPAGHAHGWEEVKGFYKFFGSSFSERKLTVRDVSTCKRRNRVGGVLLALRRETKQGRLSG